MPLLLAGLAVTACGPGTGDRLTSDAARSIVAKTLLARYPDLPLEPALDCIVANASDAELRGLASDALTGPSEATVATVAAISRRPAARACFARDGLTPPTL